MDKWTKYLHILFNFRVDGYVWWLLKSVISSDRNQSLTVPKGASDFFPVFRFRLTHPLISKLKHSRPNKTVTLESWHLGDRPSMLKPTQFKEIVKLFGSNKSYKNRMPPKNLYSLCLILNVLFDVYVLLVHCNFNPGILTTPLVSKLRSTCFYC